MFFFRLWLYIATIIYGIFKYHINLHCNIPRIERQIHIWVSCTKLVTLAKKYTFWSLLHNRFLSKLFSLDKWWTSTLDICFLFVCKPRNLVNHRNLWKMRIVLWMCLGGKNDVLVSIVTSKGDMYRNLCAIGLRLQRLTSYETREVLGVNGDGFPRIMIDLRTSIVLPIIIMVFLADKIKLHIKRQSTYRGWN